MAVHVRHFLKSQSDVAIAECDGDASTALLEDVHHERSPSAMRAQHGCPAPTQPGLPACGPWCSAPSSANAGGAVRSTFSIIARDMAAIPALEGMHEGAA